MNGRNWLGVSALDASSSLNLVILSVGFDGVDQKDGGKNFGTLAYPFRYLVLGQMVQCLDQLRRRIAYIVYALRNSDGASWDICLVSLCRGVTTPDAPPS